MVSFSRTHFKLGVGCVIKNTEEALVYAMSKMIPMYLFPTEVEALALKEATLWICQLHLSHVSIEMDCKSVVDVINYCRRVACMSVYLHGRLGYTLAPPYGLRLHPFLWKPLLLIVFLVDFSY